MTQPQPSDLLELRKDISMPNKYQRAGFTATAALWEQDFPGCTGLMWREWFINLSEPKSEIQTDPIRDTVREVFTNRGLKSLSYMDAACDAIKAYQEKYLK